MLPAAVGHVHRQTAPSELAAFVSALSQPLNFNADASASRFQALVRLCDSKRTLDKSSSRPYITLNQMWGTFFVEEIETLSGDLVL